MLVPMNHINNEHFPLKYTGCLSKIDPQLPTQYRHRVMVTSYIGVITATLEKVTRLVQKTYYG